MITQFDRYWELDSLYLPSHPGQNPFSDLIASNDPYAFARSYAYNVAPVNDNAPFFFFTLKAGQILGEKGLRESIDWKVNLGVLVLLLVFVISLCAVLGFLVLPLAFKGVGAPVCVSAALFCRGGIGLHPRGDRIHSALRTVSGTSHVCADCGYFSADDLQRSWQPVLTAVAAAGRDGLGAADIGGRDAAGLRVLPADQARPTGRAGLRIATAGERRAADPLGFVMGMPFPTGLRALAATPAPEFLPGKTTRSNGPGR